MLARSNVPRADERVSSVSLIDPASAPFELRAGHHAPRARAVRHLGAAALVLFALFAATGCHRRTLPPNEEEVLPTREVPAAPRPIPAPRPTPKPTLGPNQVLFNVADAAHVQPDELIAQARPLALQVDRHAILTSISVGRPISGGTVDLSAYSSQYVVFRFEYQYLDKTRPVGQDKIEGMVDVRAESEHLTTRRDNSAPSFIMRLPEAVPPPDPRCSLRHAWQAAVKSGVPENALATVHYAEAWQFNLGPTAWTFHVDGHRELERRIHGATCAVIPR
jgi:hypothetical protein